MQLQDDLSLLTFSRKKRRKHSIMTELFLSLKYHMPGIQHSDWPGLWCVQVCMLDRREGSTLLMMLFKILTENLNTTPYNKVNI